MENEMLVQCKDKFAEIQKRLEKGDNEFDIIGKTVAVLDERQKNTQKSLDLVNKALWAIVAFALTTLAAFFIWFVQNK